MSTIASPSQLELWLPAAMEFVNVWLQHALCTRLQVSGCSASVPRHRTYDCGLGLGLGLGPAGPVACLHAVV